MHDFLDKIFAEYDTEYEMLYKRFLVIMDEIDDVGIEHDLFHTVSEHERPDRDFWMLISPLECRNFFISIIHHIYIGEMSAYRQGVWSPHLLIIIIFECPKVTFVNRSLESDHVCIRVAIFPHGLIIAHIMNYIYHVIIVGKTSRDPYQRGD